MCALTNTSLIIYKQHQHIISVQKERLIVMAMASSTNLLHLLVLLLGLSHILCLNAVPVTRIGSVVDQIRVRQVSENIHLVNAKKNPDGEIINPRMMPELNDYPGSGANNRHTPSKT